ncbi:MAG: transporter substrate-binding domain-containing protein [Aquimonas sp.]|nr:transporter substrate-binding domain-containing protein [Aquimonas sp.]
MGAPQSLVVSWPASMLDDPRGHYPIELLQLALRHAGERYRIEPARGDLSQSRSLVNLELGRGLDVAWTFSTRERERRLLPVRIPIDRGLLGWRLLLVREDSPAAAGVDEPALRALRLAQGHDWPDLAVLRHNGLRVAGGSSYTGLFEMLRLGRIDAFPRSVSEIYAELQADRAHGLTVLPGWTLQYPAPAYFFVNRERPELAAEIEAGLRSALADGSWTEVFQRHFGPALTRAQLSQRRALVLENPDLHPSTPLADPSLWYRPGTDA